jgi:hypothetical protein
MKRMKTIFAEDVEELIYTLKSAADDFYEMAEQIESAKSRPQLRKIIKRIYSQIAVEYIVYAVKDAYRELGGK